MVNPKKCGLFLQAAMDTILKHPDCPFYMPIGFTVANGDVVVDDAQPFAEPCKAASKLGTVVCLDVVWLAPQATRSSYKNLVPLQLCS